MPPEVYTSEAFLALERERVFRGEWICVGRADEVPDPGDYFTTEIDAVPVLVVRSADGTIRAFANVCRHRAAVVACGSGTAKTFTCPYHGWTYDTHGKLLGPQRMAGQDAFDPAAIGLPGLATEIWNGFLYVNLDAEAPPLAPRLRGLEPMLANYHVESMRTVVHKREEWRTNWKNLTENFMEAYHVPVTHPRTLLPIAPIENVAILPGGEGYHFYRHTMGGEYQPQPLEPEIAIDNPDLTDHEYYNAYVGCVFPTHVFSVTWDWVFWLSLQPRGPSHVRIECGVAGPVRLPPGQSGHPSFPFESMVDAINAEDRLRVEAVQQGLESGFARQGPLHELEAPVRDLYRYLLRRLCPEERPATPATA